MGYGIGTRELYEQNGKVLQSEYHECTSFKEKSRIWGRSSLLSVDQFCLFHGVLSSILQHQSGLWLKIESNLGYWFGRRFCVQAQCGGKHYQTETPGENVPFPL